MPYSIRVFMRPEDGGYKAECLEVDASACGRTIDETLGRLRAEVNRCLDSVTREQLGLEPDPTLFITLEDVPIASACRCRHGKP